MFVFGIIDVHVLLLPLLLMCAQTQSKYKYKKIAGTEQHKKRYAPKPNHKPPT